MILLQNEQLIILKLKNSNRVLQSIPTAKSLSIKGKTIVIIPHREDEVKVLRNLGIKAPAPILSYYNWSGNMTPYNHQRATSAFLTLHNKSLVFNEIGTGKTLSALWAADYLMSKNIIKKVLIMSRLSTLDLVWGDNIFTEFHHRTMAILHGTAAKRRKLLERNAHFDIINHEGFGIIADDVINKYDLIIFDEATAIKNPQTKMAKLFRKWVKKQPNIKLWLMTGTPTPNGPVDAWSMADLMGTLNGRSYYSFKEATMRKVSPWRWIPRDEASSIVEVALQPAVRYTANSCLDLPTTIFHVRKAELSKEQAKCYKSMLKDYVAEVAGNDGVISAVNEVTKLQKLVQIACGVAYTPDGGTIEIDCAPRIRAVKEILEDIGGKAIIFTPLVGTLHMLYKQLSTKWRVGRVSGSVPAPKRNEIFREFQHGDLDILLAHPATMAHGLTLTAAKSVIWYGPITSTEQYIQANGRVERIGKHFVTNVVHIVSTKLEQKMFDRVKHNQTLQGLLLNSIEQQTEDNT